MRVLNICLYTILISTLLLSCKKDKEENNPSNSNTTTNKQSDQSGGTEVDEALDNVNEVINARSGNGANKRVAAMDLPCGVVSVDSSNTNSSGQRIYKMKYGNQTPCGYKYKSGTVSFALENGSQFNQTGAKYVVTFIDYTVEVKATGNIVKLNGNIAVTNVDGGYIWEPVLSSKIIKHKVRGSVNITYTNNEVRPKNIYQLKTWQSTGGWAGLSLTVEGDTLINGINVSETGKTYEGNYDYQTQILTNWVWANCGSTFAGPYVLQKGRAKMAVTIPAVNNAYVEIEAGYKWDLKNLTTTPVLVNNCDANAYKIFTVFGPASKTSHQLY